MTEKRRENSQAARMVIWDMAQRRLSKTLPAQAGTRWLENLELVSLGEEKAEFVYRGQAPLAEFEKEYGAAFEEAVSWAAGRPLKTVITPSRSRRGASPERAGAAPEGRGAARRAKRQQREQKAGPPSGRWLLPAVTGVCAVFIVGALAAMTSESSFETAFYRIPSDRITGNVRIVQLSNLDVFSPEETAQLADPIRRLDPDLLVLAGNVAGEDGGQAAAELCRSLSPEMQVCYLYGAGEQSGADSASALDALSETEGIHVLRNEAVSLQIGGNPIEVFGMEISDPTVYQGGLEENYAAFLEGDGDAFRLTLCADSSYFAGKENLEWGDAVLAATEPPAGYGLPVAGDFLEKVSGIFSRPKSQSGPDVEQPGLYELNGTPLLVTAGVRGGMRPGGQAELSVVDLNRN